MFIKQTTAVAMVLALVLPFAMMDSSDDDHSLFRRAASTVLQSRPVVYSTTYSTVRDPEHDKAGAMTAVESLQVDCSNGEGVWKAIAHSSHHRWDRRGTPGASYERADGGVTLVVRLQGCFASLCPVLNGGRVFTPPPARGTRVIFIGDFDSDVGMLSTRMPDRTVDWGDLYDDMRSCLPDSDVAPSADPEFQPLGTPARRYVGMEGLQAFLDDERLLLFAVNQHQAAPPAPHAKLLSTEQFGGAALLDEVWHKFAVERADEWDYRRLTERYWLELLADAAAAGSVDAITAQHPLRTELRGAAAAA